MPAKTLPFERRSPKLAPSRVKLTFDIADLLITSLDDTKIESPEPVAIEAATYAVGVG